jgi:hypothetical protein
MSYTVIDAKGRTLELEDDEVMPDKTRLHISTQSMFLDAEQKATIAHFGYRDARPTGALTDAQAAAQYAADSYAEMNARLGTRKAQRAPMPTPEQWQTLPKRKRKVRLDGVAADADPHAAAREAYEARSQRLQDAWRRPKTKAPHIVATMMDRAPNQPAWVRQDGSTSPPSVGGSGTRSPYSGQHQDRAAQAYNARNVWLENRWRDHKKPFVPEVR